MGDRQVTGASGWVLAPLDTSCPPPLGGWLVFMESPRENPGMDIVPHGEGLALMGHVPAELWMLCHLRTQTNHQCEGQGPLHAGSPG